MFREDDRCEREERHLEMVELGIMDQYRRREDDGTIAYCYE